MTEPRLGTGCFFCLPSKSGGRSNVSTSLSTTFSTALSINVSTVLSTVAFNDFLLTSLPIFVSTAVSAAVHNDCFKRLSQRAFQRVLSMLPNGFPNQLYTVKTVKTFSNSVYTFKRFQRFFKRFPWMLQRSFQRYFLN